MDKPSANATEFNLRCEYPALLGIVLFIIILMYPFTLGGKALMPDMWLRIHPWALGRDIGDARSNSFDAVLELDPWYSYSQQCMKEGRVPHWNPWSFCGTPLYANRLVPFFHPDFIIAELISSPHRLLGWFQLFNLIVSGIGAYFLFRKWRISALASYVGSCLWIGSTMHYLALPVWTLASMGFPWILYAVDSYIERHDFKYIVIGSIFSGFVLMTGYPVNIVHFSYFLVLYAVGRWWLPWKTSKEVPFMRIVLCIALIYIFGIGISSVANYPAYEYSKYTSRTLSGYDNPEKIRDARWEILIPGDVTDTAINRYHRVSCLSALAPNHSQDRRFGGILLYSLGLLGLLSSRKRTKWLAILGVFFAIPVFNVHAFFAFMDFLPGWDITIQPPFEIVTMISCLLVPFGIDVILRGATALGVRFAKEIYFLLSLAIAAYSAVIITGTPVSGMSGTFMKLYLAGFVAISILVFLRLILKKFIAQVTVLAIAAILIHTLGTHWYLQPGYSDINYMPDTPFITWLRENVSGQPYRIARYSPQENPTLFHQSKSPFAPNRAMPLGILDTGGYDSLIPGGYVEYINQIEDAVFYDRAVISFNNPVSVNHPNLREMGVRWMISLGELPYEARQGWTLVWDDRIDSSTDQGIFHNSDDFIQVWELDNPLPVAFMKNSDSIIRDGVIFEKFDSEYVHIHTVETDDCELFFTQNYLPEWHANVDGVEVPIVTYDNAFMRINVPSGEHSIEFRYIPDSFRKGLVVSILNLAVLALVWMLNTMAMRKCCRIKE